MTIKIALAGNPNSGKTTMFNELTGSSQYVGNWPGVTVEKKEGKLKGHKDIIITDLPGIYSLSPYTLEEVITRNYLLDEEPDVIINIVDASNIERNLYLTTQILELGIPMIVALNMMDVVIKNGDKIESAKLSKELGCAVVETSAVNGSGMKELMGMAIQLSKSEKKSTVLHKFDAKVEASINQIAEIISDEKLEASELRWYAIKLFERDEKVLQKLKPDSKKLSQIEAVIKSCEDKFDDDSESIITNDRYNYLGKLVSACCRKSQKGMTASDKIDRVVTNKWLALPVFFSILWVIYYISISTVGDMTIGWVEGLFALIQGGAENLLIQSGASNWVIDLVVNGIIGNITAIFIYVPQLMILFLFLSLLEDSGYMARVAFILDRIFRKFGLSGKSFIPMLIGTGCSIPGIMASRTIENDRDRKMTITLTPFIPCGAKLPVFAMFIAMIFSEQTWVGPAIYMISIAMVIMSGILLKRSERFAGEPAPFVMELPTYKLPRFKGVAIHMWEKAVSFVKKAGTVIFVACATIWFLQSFSFSMEYLGSERVDESILASIGHAVRWVFIPLGFGDSWAPAVATITGLVAREVVVATFASVGSVIQIAFTQVTAFSFMIFIMFAAPCFAAIGAMRKEFGNWKMTFYAIGYQTGVAYLSAFLVNVLGNMIFKGTQAVEPKILDISLMEAASENTVINGDIVLIVFGAILIIALAIGIFGKIRNSRQYADVLR